MMKNVILAGFGGQGVLTMGLFLAHAGMTEGKKVAYVPAYGAEMRGGTANCTVTISDRDISSPVVAYPQAAVVMNHPSLDKFESLVHREAARTDIRSYAIPAQELANQVGLASGSNMVMLGVLLQLTNLINNDNIYDYLLKTFKGKYLDKMPLNMTTIKAGREYAANMIKANNRNIA